MLIPWPYLPRVCYNGFVWDEARTLYVKEPLMILIRGHSSRAANTMPLANAMPLLTQLLCLNLFLPPRLVPTAGPWFGAVADRVSIHYSPPRLVTQVKGMKAALTMALFHPGCSPPAPSGRWGP